MRIFLLLVLLISSTFSIAQRMNFTSYELIQKEDMKSAPINLDNKYDGIIGSGFFTNGWTHGRAFTSMKMYTDLLLKFDLNSNIVYLNSHDTVYDITKSGIVQFDLFPDFPDTTNKISFNNGFVFDDINSNTFVNVLIEGKLSLIKYYKRDIEDVYESSPSYKEKKFIDKNKYYIANNGHLSQVSISKKNLEKLLVDKWDIISKYAKEKNISAAKEDGWIELISYYNSI